MSTDFVAITLVPGKQVAALIDAAYDGGGALTEAERKQQQAIVTALIAAFPSLEMATIDVEAIASFAQVSVEAGQSMMQHTELSSPDGIQITVRGGAAVLTAYAESGDPAPYLEVLRAQGLTLFDPNGQALAAG